MARFRLLVFIGLFVGCALAGRDFIVKKDGVEQRTDVPLSQKEIDDFKALYDKQSEDYLYGANYCLKGTPPECHDIGQKPKEQIPAEFKNIIGKEVNMITVVALERQPDNSVKQRFSVKAKGEKGLCLIYRIIGQSNDHKDC